MPIAASDIHASVGEYQRNYIYKLFIENVPTPVAAKFPNAANFQAQVDIYNDKAVFPDRKTNPITIKWAGEFFDIPGTDASTRNYEFSFYEDQKMWVYDFFDACKDLTGNEENQAGVISTEAKFNIGIAKVSVDKETITNYRRLVGCRVYGVKSDDIDKAGDSVSKLAIEIRWDRNQNDKSKRGQTV